MPVDDRAYKFYLQHKSNRNSGLGITNFQGGRYKIMNAAQESLQHGIGIAIRSLGHFQRLNRRITANPANLNYRPEFYISTIWKKIKD
jgi:hypothetical protein